MEKNNNKFITYIFSFLFAIIFLAIPLIFLDQTAMNGTYIGEEGLKTALNVVIVGMINKLAWGLMISVLVSIIYSLAFIKENKKVINIRLMIIVIIIYFLCFPGNVLIYNNQNNKTNNEIITLYNIIKDLSSMETYEIKIRDYEFMKLEYVQTGKNSATKHSREEWYIKFDDNNYIAITEKDKKTIEYYINTISDENSITVLKNTGLIYYINGENKQVSDELLKEKRINERKKLIKLEIDKDGIINKSNIIEENKEDILSTWWSITLNGEPYTIINCENQARINIGKMAYIPGKYNVKIIAIYKDRKEYQISNEIEYEKVE